MKTIWSYFLVLATVLSSTVTNSAVVVQGDREDTVGFTRDVNVKAYNRASGVFYVGLDGGAGNFALSKVRRNDTTTRLKFEPLAGTASFASPLNGKNIQLLALAGSESETRPNIAVRTDTTTSVFIVSDDGLKVQELNDILDANADGMTDVLALAANKKYIFAVVGPDALGFTNKGGIAVICINPTTLELGQTAAEIGDATTKAKRLDDTTIEIKINNDPTIDPNDTKNSPLLWDDKLQRLFNGFEIRTAEANGDGAKSVIVARVNDVGKMEFATFAPNDAFTAGETDKIIGAVSDGGSALTLTAKHLQTLHMSTGPSYLIVNGGNGAADETGNKVYALPLVNTDDPKNVAQGVLADKNMFNETTHRFEVPVTDNAGLTTSDDPAALVGAGDIPIDAVDNISDMVAVGDTVYVSIFTVQTDTTETGILYSQALFDQDGKVVRWTPWTKRGIGLDAFSQDIILQGNKKFDGSVKLFAVDAFNGKIWFVEGTTSRTVGITEWTASLGSANSLVARTAKALKKGSYSVLDLEQSTRGFTGAGAPQDRYVLFGGANKVVFARTSLARTADPTLRTPQTGFTDYSMPQNFLETTLPAGGAIRVLEYSRQNEGTDTNYFFAGTDDGLFVFTNADGDGFNEQDLGELNAALFTERSWQKVQGIEGAITDITTLGNQLYVMTCISTPDTPLKAFVYSISFMDTITDMFDSKVVIAESNTDTLRSTRMFYGMRLIATANDDTNTTAEQLVLATNQGLYRSSTPGGVQNANTQADAAWSLVKDDSTMYNDVFGIDTPIPTTVWPASVEDEQGFRTFERGSVHQVSGTDDAGPFNFVPEQYNPIGVTDNSKTLDLINYYFSDGARRFFIVNRLHDPGNANQLMTLPFDSKEWNSTHPNFPVDQLIRDTSRFYWVKQIGSTGKIMAGTDDGVLSLE